MKQCPTCQRHFADTDDFCPFDGNQLHTAKATPAPSSAGPDAKTSVIDVVLPPGADMPGLRPMESLVGATLDGRYRIEEKIGEGGMGVVFRARHIVIEKPVAIKVLKPEVARDQNVVRRFVQEAKAASRIGHPNIVDVTDFGSTPDGTTYSVMEYVSGTTLSDEIRREGRLYVTRVVPIVRQLARALGAAHEKGIVHRDVKPENVFLVNREGKQDFVKIVDFGIAKVQSVKKDPTLSPRLTRQGTVFGTPEYMPPEQAAGQSTDHRVDIYALGIVMWEMLVGHVPLKGETVVKTLSMQMVAPIPRPNEVAPELALGPGIEQVIMRAVAKRREDRYQNMAEFLMAIESVSSDAAMFAPQPGQKVDAPPLVASPDERTLSPNQPVGAPPPSPEEAARAKAQARATRETTPAPDTVPDERPPSMIPGEPMFAGAAPKVLRRFDDIMPAPEEAEPPARWPQALAVFLLVGAIGVGVAAYLKNQDSQAVASVPSLDAAIARAPIPPDAAIVEMPADATVVAEIPDAGRKRRPIRKPKHDGARKIVKRPPPPEQLIVPRGNVSIVVETRPRGGTLYMMDGAYGGGDGTTMTRRGGERVRVKCKMTGYESGTTEVVFDGQSDIAVCNMIRIKKCLPGVKNPFDDCEDTETP